MTALPTFRTCHLERIFPDSRLLLWSSTLSGQGTLLFGKSAARHRRPFKIQRQRVQSAHGLATYTRHS